MAVRVQASDVEQETNKITGKFPETLVQGVRRPVDQVFARVARSRVEKMEVIRRRQLWQGNCEVVTSLRDAMKSAGVVETPRFSQDFEVALKQRGRKARELARELQETELMYCIVLGLPEFGGRKVR